MNERINGSIYSLTYPVGMSYIGLTTRTGEIRRREHIRKSRMAEPPTKIAYAIKEHGYENFELKILHTGISDWKLLNELEIAEIANHDSYYNGYNCRKGRPPEFRLAKIWEHREEIADMYETQEIPVYKIAEDFGVGERTIRKLLDRLDIQRRNAGFYRKGKPSANRSPNRLAAERDADEIYRLCTQEFITANKIAKMYGCGCSVITRILKSMGVELRGKHPAWLYKEEIARLYDEEGLVMTQIAERYKCDMTVISDILKDMDVEIRDSKTPVWQHEQKIARLYTEHLLSANQIADLYVCSVYLIQSILKSCGVTLRNSRQAQLDQPSA